MRGYFGVGVDGVSKAMNLGNLSRIANAFDASFFFTVNSHHKLADAQSDTSRAQQAMPYYRFNDIGEFRLPIGCTLLAVLCRENETDCRGFMMHVDWSRGGAHPRTYELREISAAR